MKGNNFQLIVLIIFIAGAVFGVLVFSGMIPIGNKDKAVLKGTVVLWGTETTEVLTSALNYYAMNNPNIVIKYIQKDPTTFDQELLEALAASAGPDMFILPDNLIFHYKNKIMPIPYISFPASSFNSTFAQSGEIYLNNNGILALPLTIDPMVMYYNRNILDANNIPNPPVYWDDLSNLVPTLTKKDSSGNIIKSTIALGQFANIEHAKDILATIFMQAGNPIVLRKNEAFYSTLSELSFGNLEETLNFYTNFSNPINSFYSWNASLPNSRNYFSSDNLAFYFGYASELASLSAKNPNQNFAVSAIPQIKSSNFKLTFGHTKAIAISAYTKNAPLAFSVANILATSDFAKEFANSLSIAPARRDLLASKPTNSFAPVFYNSALYAKSWVDPSPSETNTIFQKMVENVLSNNLSSNQSIGDASSKLGLLLQK
ncbi:MAG: extracellular solute-binding protein [Candidatus Nomurabacteria bacterium]|nr:extracellular solute-binding protein [Candidatus Nomurabacteria bacterium]